jgi:hypothetical protein
VIEVVEPLDVIKQKLTGNFLQSEDESEVRDPIKADSNGCCLDSSDCRGDRTRGRVKAGAFWAPLFFMPRSSMDLRGIGFYLEGLVNKFFPRQSGETNMLK